MDDEEELPELKLRVRASGSRRRVIQVAFGCGLLALGSCLFSPLLVSGHYNGRSEAALEALAAEDLSVSDEALHPVAPANNGAPAVTSVAKLVRDLPEEIYLIPGAPPTQLAEARVDLESNGAWMIGLHEGSEPASRAKLERLLGSLFERLAGSDSTLDAALAKRCVFPVDWSAGYEAKMPHMMDLKQLANVLRVRAGWRMLEGQPREAWADVERMLLVARACKGVTLIECLVQIAISNVCARTIEELLWYGPAPRPGRARRLRQLLKELDDPKAHQSAMRGELNMATHSIPADFDQFAQSQLPGVAGKLPASLVGLTLYPYWRADLIETMARVVRTSGRGRAEIQALDDQLAADAKAGKLGALSHLLLPALVKAFDKHLENLATLRLAALAIRIGHELPRLPPNSLPADPCGEGRDALGYRWLTTGRARIWSRGRDGEDDKGTPPPEDQALPERGVDLVFELGRREARPAEEPR